MTRIRIGMSVAQAVAALSGGNPGAISCLMGAITRGPEIDPDDQLLPWSILICLDHVKIYDEKIWILFVDVCDHDFVKFFGIIRGVRFGITRERQIMDWTNNRGQGCDVEKIMQAVQERLPRFGAITVTAETIKKEDQKCLSQPPSA